MSCASSAALRTFKRAGGPTPILASFAASIASLILAAPVRAADPSAYVTEVLTPAGWELFGVWCGERDEPANSVELRTPDGWTDDSELRIPDGWASSAVSVEHRWGGFACSEVVVPLEWLEPSDPHS
jgi:hypothetical protein